MCIRRYPGMIARCTLAALVLWLQPTAIRMLQLSIETTVETACNAANAWRALANMVRWWRCGSDRFLAMAAMHTTRLFNSIARSVRAHWVVRYRAPSLYAPETAGRTMRSCFDGRHGRTTPGGAVTSAAGLRHQRLRRRHHRHAAQALMAQQPTGSRESRPGSAAKGHVRSRDRSVTSLATPNVGPPTTPPPLATRGQTSKRPSARPRSHQPAMATLVSAVIRAARPTFRNAHDKVAYAVHAAVMSRGWTLIATGAAADAEPQRGASL